jgi:endonuclease III
VPSRLDDLLRRLERFYGAVPRPPREAFALFVWEVLSPHSTARKRDAAISALTKIPALTPDAMHRAPLKKLEAAVALAGPYAAMRMRALRTGVDHFRRSPDLTARMRGPLPAARRALKGLPQMGEGGAYRMLLFAAAHPVLPVDARVSRAARRLGYGALQRDFTATARAVRDAVSRELPADVAAYRRAYLYLSHHGAASCTEAAPHCGVCPVLRDCPEGKRLLSSAKPSASAAS